MENKNEKAKVSDELLTDVSGGASGNKFLPCSDCRKIYPSNYVKPMNGKLLCKDCYAKKLLLDGISGSGKPSDSVNPSTPTTSHDETGAWGGW